MTTRLEEIIRQMQLKTNDDTYCLIQLPANGITVAAGILAEIGEPFSALIIDPEEVSLILEEEALTEYSARLRDYQVAEIRYRLITIDIILEPTLVGFLARLSVALAGAEIPVLALSAYSRDHLLVPIHDLEKAVNVLNNLKSGQMPTLRA